MNATHLSLSWGTSRGRETYGYTICRLTDDSTGKVYRCMGGGYDMVGTVFGLWLEDVHAEALANIADDRAYYVYERGVGTKPTGKADALYGMTLSWVHPRHSIVSLDGGCGIDSMLRIAGAIGLEVTREFKHSGRNRGTTTGWLVSS